MAQAVDMSKHFSVPQLLRFTAPSMAMMLFTSIYGVVDGLFISNFAGKTDFAAVNLIMPFIMVIGSTGFMVGTGGGALVGQARGEGDEKRANRWFSLIVWFGLILGIFFALFGAAVMRPVACALGADANMVDTCVLYGRISMISLPFFVLQTAFQPLFSTAGKPNLGLVVTVLSGCANMVLDFILVGLLGFGVAGAAAATVTSEYVGGGIPLVYFLCKNNSHLRLGKTRLEWRVIGKTCFNGSSEMIGSIIMAVAGMVYNWQLMRMVGEDGVAAYGVVMYAGFIFGALLGGYGMGVGPLISFQHGAQNNTEKRSLFRRSVLVLVVAGACMVALAQVFAAPLAQIFTGYDQTLCTMTVHAFRIYTLCFLLMGLNMFGSSLFTALGNGIVSAAISFLRTLVFEIGSVIVLPLLVGVEGIWFSVDVAEVASLVLVICFLAKLGKRYGLFA